MRRVRIAIVGESPCDRCHAACCKQNGHEFAVLLHGDEARKFAIFSQTVQVKKDGENFTERVIPYVNGKCPFLDVDDRCTIYEDRPFSCRQFQCTKRYNLHGIGKHDRFLNLNPKVQSLLETW